MGNHDFEVIRQSGLIVVLRGLDTQLSIATAEALYEVGIRVLEVTVDSPGALETIAGMTQGLPDDVLIGAGTVLDATSAVQAIHAGARFLFAPNLNVSVINAANRYGRIAIPGVMTPTEMVQAVEAGARAVKVFPAIALGPDYVKQVRAPLPHIPIIPTGGINEENVGRFIEAGAIAAGVGGSLLGDDPQNGRLDRVKERAARLVQRVAEARGELR